MNNINAQFYYNYRQNAYNRQSAVQYALTYALKPNPAYRYFPLVNDTSGDCANFISQCLYAGNAPMIFSGNTKWFYNKNNTVTTKDDTWSLSWTVAHSLYWYLKINSEKNSKAAKGIEVQDTNNLNLGDLAFYEDYKGLIFHSAIITAFNKIPLVSHHSYEALNVPYNKSYGYKKVHFLKIVI
jgi:hypothetical protein